MVILYIMVSTNKYNRSNDAENSTFNHKIFINIDKA